MGKKIVKKYRATKTHTAVSMTDIIATIDNERIGEISKISYDITRSPIPTGIGPIRYQRTIQGSLSGVIFDRHILACVLKKYKLTYADEIPAFTIHLTHRNEAGSICTMSILGCKIIYEGFVANCEDLTASSTLTFQALDIIPWAPYESE
jgi:hypothetical protein